jgi:hypothetical protein
LSDINRLRYIRGLGVHHISTGSWVQSDPKSIENRQEMCWHREELNQIFSALAIAFLNYLWRFSYR